MKTLNYLVIIALIFSMSCNESENKYHDQTINTVIGDLSYVEKFGTMPNEKTDDQLRIFTHLEYVEERLKARDVSHLPAVHQAKRKQLLSLLQEYRLARKYPINYSKDSQRKPCFIDQQNNICAVGYLVAKTAGWEIAREINELYQYSNIVDMKAPGLLNWIRESGLTIEECAMIQPSYQPTEPNNSIDNTYGTMSAILTGTNMAFISLNSLQVVHPGNTKAVPIVGLITGAGQFAYGAYKLDPPTALIAYPQSEGDRILSYINMAFGTSTMLISAYNLIHNSKYIQRKTSWNIYSFPANQQSVGLGFSVARRF